MSKPYDVIVVGGGPSGTTAATLLARAGWQVALIESATFPRRKVCGEFISATTWPLLRALGVADPLLAKAGPAIHRVGLFAGTLMLDAPLTMPHDSVKDSGRAVVREYLDTFLMQAAVSAGAEVWQPWTLVGFDIDAGSYVCRIAARETSQRRTLRAPLVVAAHGSWHRGAMPTHARRETASASDLFGFKAHFRSTGLATDLMPLISFPGGYGGMVHADNGRVSLSCCIRRDQLTRCRRESPQLSAGAALLIHLQNSCAGVAQTLATAELDSAWLSAGPLQTGFRSFGEAALFTVGNATAEAHPIIAEGISMAMQSAALLCAQLLAYYSPTGGVSPSPSVLTKMRAGYALTWQRHFTRRIYLACVAANLFMRPASARVAALTLRRLPWILSRAARWSGKMQPLRLDLACLSAPP